jgi:preprotein translocase subunit SecY
VLDFFNMFSGGSLERMSLIALGVMPYITASIVVQLATSMSPTLPPSRKRVRAAQEDQPIYPLRHGLPLRDPGLFHRRRPGGWGDQQGGPP